MNNKPQKAVFLDRDGVINRCAAPHCYITRWKDFEFLPGAIDGIKMLNEAGYLVLIVTNQRGIARGMCTAEQIATLHRSMCEELEKMGAHIDGIYVCPHDDGECECRKPEIGLFLQAESEWYIDKEKSWCIGDFQSDIEAGNKYGINTILIGDTSKQYGQTLTYCSLEEAGKYLASLEE